MLISATLHVNSPNRHAQGRTAARLRPSCAATPGRSPAAVHLPTALATATAAPAPASATSAGAGPPAISPPAAAPARMCGQHSFVLNVSAGSVTTCSRSALVRAKQRYLYIMTCVYAAQCCLRGAQLGMRPCPDSRQWGQSALRRRTPPGGEVCAWLCCCLRHIDLQDGCCVHSSCSAAAPVQGTPCPPSGFCGVDETGEWSVDGV